MTCGALYLLLFTTYLFVLSGDGALVWGAFRLAGESLFFAWPSSRNQKKGRDQLGPRPSWPAELGATQATQATHLRLGVPDSPRLFRSNPALLDSLEGDDRPEIGVVLTFGCKV